MVQTLLLQSLSLLDLALIFHLYGALSNPPNFLQHFLLPLLCISSHLFFYFETQHQQKYGEHSHSAYYHSFYGLGSFLGGHQMADGLCGNLPLKEFSH